MRLRVAFGLAVCAVISGALRAEEFPYTAYVSSDDVYVRSGPGKNYYPTSKLRRGQEVEVYRHDPGGWFAIRPPETSFSWVSGRFVEPTDQNYAEVTGDRVMSRVGSTLSDIRDVIQVRLYQGEEVEVLEAKRFGDGPNAQTWYKISPPAGEFRWVFGQLLDRDPPAGPDRDGTRENLLLSDDIDGEPYYADPDEVESEDDRAESFAEQYEDEGEPDYDEPRRLPEDDRDRKQAAPSNDREEDHQDNNFEDAESRNRRASHEEPRQAETRKRRRSSAADRELLADDTEGRPRRRITFEDDRSEIDMTLSVMVAEEPTVWSFSSLRPRTEALLSHAETAVQRGQARLLLNRIKRFEDIKGRYEKVVEVGAVTDRRNRQLKSVQQLREGEARAAQLSWRFDGVGRLTRVVSPQVGAPRYALVDSAGSVNYFVTPAPGLQLQNLVGRRVGLSGSLQQAPQSGSKHLTAQRVTVLDGRKVR